MNIIDDDTPEVEEYFKVSLKNPKGGAEIGFGGQVTVIVPTNDDAHGVIGFAQVSRYDTDALFCVIISLFKHYHQLLYNKKLCYYLSVEFFIHGGRGVGAR